MTVSTSDMRFATKTWINFFIYISNNFFLKKKLNWQGGLGEEWRGRRKKILTLKYFPKRIFLTRWPGWWMVAWGRWPRWMVVVGGGGLSRGTNIFEILKIRKYNLTFLWRELGMAYNVLGKKKNILP